MANRFEKKGGFAGMAAVRRKINTTTPEKIDSMVDWRPIAKLLNKRLDRKA